MDGTVIEKDVYSTPSACEDFFQLCIREGSFFFSICTSLRISSPEKGTLLQNIRGLNKLSFGDIHRNKITKVVLEDTERFGPESILEED
jgi:hypothetical protein